MINGSILYCMLLPCFYDLLPGGELLLRQTRFRQIRPRSITASCCSLTCCHSHAAPSPVSPCVPRCSGDASTILHSWRDLRATQAAIERNTCAQIVPSWTVYRACACVCALYEALGAKVGQACGVLDVTTAAAVLSGRL
eukprot:5756152-Amphidinium_carterae.1